MGGGKNATPSGIFFNIFIKNERIELKFCEFYLFLIRNKFFEKKLGN